MVVVVGVVVELGVLVFIVVVVVGVGVGEGVATVVLATVGPLVTVTPEQPGTFAGQSQTTNCS